MLLRETVKKLKEIHGWTQRDLADKLGLKDQQRISSLENAGTNLETQWETFLKLLPYCLQHDLISKKDLLPPRSEHDGNGDNGNPPAATPGESAGDQRRKKRRNVR